MGQMLSSLWAKIRDEYYLKWPESHLGMHLHFCLSSSWRRLQPKRFEVVVIARTPCFMDESTSTLRLMVIHTDSRGVSRRLAAGLQIDDHAWAATKPQWRTVFLV